MRVVLIWFALLAMSSTAIAGPKCTDEPTGKWLSEAEMKQKISAMGFKFEIFKKTTGNCYEIYGKNDAGRRIEIYFHPISGKIVKKSSL
ncbi:hypothetical protein MnTg02_03315 [bacterium MnTg02]|nr:hypothetical protein MnTg02_03315 [bacterium MnTg02]